MCIRLNNKLYLIDKPAEFSYTLNSLIIKTFAAGRHQFIFKTDE